MSDAQGAGRSDNGAGTTSHASLGFARGHMYVCMYVRMYVRLPLERNHMRLGGWINGLLHPYTHMERFAK